MSIRRGFPATARGEVAALYWQAFSGKLGRVMAPDSLAIAFVDAVLNPRFALCAFAPEGRLMGVAGFKTSDGAFVGGDFTDLSRVYGPFGAFWRGLLLNMLERPIEPGRLLMDGIFVERGCRGAGVGSALLDAIAEEARRRGLSEVRLDVIDGNPRARALYERKGFTVVDRSTMGPLSLLFGFKQATTMVQPL